MRYLSHNYGIISPYYEILSHYYEILTHTFEILTHRNNQAYVVVAVWSASSRPKKGVRFLCFTVKRIIKNNEAESFQRLKSHGDVK